MILLKDISNLNYDKILSYNNIDELINKEGYIGNSEYLLNPLITAISVYHNNPEVATKIIKFLMKNKNINVSRVFILKGKNGWSDEIYSVFHLIAELNIPYDICELILNSPSFNVESLNTINHDDYRPLDLADEYNKDIVKLIESKNGQRHFRVGPGFKKDTFNSPK